MRHQPCGEKAAIFIHSYSRPVTIFAEKRDKKRFRSLDRIQKRNGTGARTRGTSWISYDSSEMVTLHLCLLLYRGDWKLPYPSPHDHHSVVTVPKPGNKRCWWGGGKLEPCAPFLGGTMQNGAVAVTKIVPCLKKLTSRTTAASNSSTSGYTELTAVSRRLFAHPRSQ